MSEDEFWNSTIYKINKLYDLYKQEYGLTDKNNKNYILKDEKTLNKWGRPVTYSTDF